MSAQDPSPAAAASESDAVWLQAVRERQMASLTPEQQASVAQRRERTQEQNQGRVAELQRRAGRIETCSAVSRAAWVGGMRNAFSPAPPPAAAPAAAAGAFSFGAPAACNFGAAPASAPALAPAVASAQAAASTSAFGAIRSFAFGASSATSAFGASPAGVSDQQFGQQVETNWLLQLGRARQ
jgi:hypothetical protein